MKKFVTSLPALIALSGFWIFLNPSYGQQVCNPGCETSSPENFVAGDVRVCAETSGLDADLFVCDLPAIPAANEISYFSYFWDFGDGQFAIVNDRNSVEYGYMLEGENQPVARVQVTSVYTDDRIIHPDSAKKLMRRSTAPTVLLNPSGNAPNEIAGVVGCDGEQVICQLELGEDELGILPVRSLVPDYPVTYVLAISDELWSNTENKNAYFDFESTDYFSNQEAWAFDDHYALHELGEVDNSKLILDLSQVGFPGTSLNGQHYIFVSMEADPQLDEKESVAFSFGFGGQQVLFSEPVSKEHDPNFKSVDPPLTCARGSLPLSVTYTVNFLNTGDQVADSINIFDYFSPPLVNNYVLDTNSIAVTISNRNVLHKSQVKDLSRPYYQFRLNRARKMIHWNLQGVLLLGKGMENESADIDLNRRDILGRIRYTLNRRQGRASPGPGVEAYHSHAEIQFGTLEPVSTGFCILRELKGDCCDISVGPVDYVDINLLEWAQRLLKGRPIKLAPIVGVRDPFAGKIVLRPNSFREHGSPTSYRYRFPEPPDSRKKTDADTLIFWAVQPPQKEDRNGKGLLRNSKTRFHQIALRICRTPVKKGEAPFPVWLIFIPAVVGVMLVMVLYFSRRSQRQNLLNTSS